MTFSTATLPQCCINNIAKDFCFVELNYRKKRWKRVDQSSFSISLETVRTAIEEQLPDIYKQVSYMPDITGYIMSFCTSNFFSSVLLIGQFSKLIHYL